ncbi:MAG: hypothetical protein ACMXYC_00425 [Candidatus Woesearchaeota archaeon]
MSKLAQAVRTGAPILIIITILVVLYIIFLPPDVRSELLDGTSSGSSGATSARTPSSSSLLVDFSFPGPGRIDPASRSSYEHDMPSMHLFSTSEAQVLFTENPFVVSYSSFSRSTHQTTFRLQDPNALSNVVMLFGMDRNIGMLAITLNGRVIYQGALEQRSSEPIRVPPELLMRDNTLEFSVNSPGWQFWRAHAYHIKDFRIQATVEDTSKQKGTSTFHLTSSQVTSAQQVRISYIPSCTQSAVGILDITLNGKLLNSHVPDCETLNTHVVQKDDVQIGTNTLSFSLTAGEVIIDRLRAVVNIDEFANDITYYFELDKELFIFTREQEAICGVADGVCPVGCSSYVDPDCCFNEFENAYWCDVPTQNSRDRCVGFVNDATLIRCSSGYRDSQGRVPDDYKGICGDNNDGVCPLGCSSVYDKDCCFEQGGYWCPSLPLSGVEDRCRMDLPADVCSLCQDGYRTESGRVSVCEVDTARTIREEVRLKDDYKVTSSFLFVDDNRQKQAQVIVNGFSTNFDTVRGTYQRDISQFVKDGSNYITIRPQTDFNFVETKISVSER